MQFASRRKILFGFSHARQNAKITAEIEYLDEHSA